MSKNNMHTEDDTLASLKIESKTINAEDLEVEALLAQAEYIKDRADEFVAVEEYELV